MCKSLHVLNLSNKAADLILKIDATKGTKVQFQNQRSGKNMQISQEKF